jgi:hypothetical protein
MQTVDTTTTRAQEPQQQQQQQRQPEFAPPQQQAPLYPGEGKEKKSRKGLILGVLAAGGVLGILGVLAVVAVGAAIFLFAAGSTSSPEQPVADPPVDPQPAVPQPAEDDLQQPAEGTPEEGSGLLDDIVQERVGDFALQQSDALPVAAGGGAIEARELLYASPDGIEAVHRMIETESPDAADEVLRAQAESYTAEGYRQVEEFEVTGRDDQRIGSGVAFVDPSGEEEAILWTNDVGFFAVIAPEGYGTDFYNNLEY